MTHVRSVLCLAPFIADITHKLESMGRTQAATNLMKQLLADRLSQLEHDMGLLRQNMTSVNDGSGKPLSSSDRLENSSTADAAAGGVVVNTSSSSSSSTVTRSTSPSPRQPVRQPSRQRPVSRQRQSRYHHGGMRGWLVFVILIIVGGLATSLTLIVCFCCPSCSYMSCLLYFGLCKRVCRFCYDVLCLRSDDPTDIYVQEYTYEKL